MHFNFLNYHNFKSYQNILTTLGGFFNYKLQLCSICHVLYTSFTCDKIFLKLKNFETYFEFLEISNSINVKFYVFFSVVNKLLSSRFSYHQNFDVQRVLFHVLCKIDLFQCKCCLSSKVIY
jgi:hypothetical protein